jgi:hypothetical protein
VAAFSEAHTQNCIQNGNAGVNTELIVDKDTGPPNMAYSRRDARLKLVNLRDHLGDSEHFQPTEIRTELLKLHGLAMDIVNNGWDGQIKEMAELAVELEEQTLDMKRSLEALHQMLSKQAYATFARKCL